MNILFISSQFPNACEPNKGIFSLQIARELNQFAHLRVVAPVPSLGPFKLLDSYKRYRTDYDIPGKEKIEGLLVYHPKYFAMPGMGFMHHLSLHNSLHTLVAGIHESWHIDAVNCHWIFPDGVAAQKVCEQIRIPIMLTPLGTDLNEYGQYVGRKKAIRSALVKADKVSVLSTPMYQRCLAMGVVSDRLENIPNGVDLSEFSPRERSKCRKELQISEDARVILFVGSLVRVKGVESLLKAFATLRDGQAKESLKLYIVGSGCLEHDLKRMSDRLRIDGDTVFVGAVKHNKLPIWMNSADCLCLPSLSEGHPNVVMEALACGLPVVASAVGSVPDYVNAQTGFLTTPSDHIELAQMLLRCLATSYQRERIRATIEDMSWKECAKRYYETLNNLMR